MAPERPGSDDERCGNSMVFHANGVTVPIVRQPLALPGDLLKEGDGATKVFTEVRVGSATTEDDDLTPLSWLQDKNLLKGIALRGGPMCPGASGGEARAHRVVIEDSSARRTGSPTSDYAEDSSDQPDSMSSSVPSSSPTPSGPQMPQATLAESHETLLQQASPSNIIPYNPKIHITSKPPYSFSCLIFMAIEDSLQRALPVKDIYAWILDHFPYFQSAPTGWKNSVRHNLSLNKCFKKVDKSPNVGKGSLWMVDPMFRPNLLQALRKAPYHPYMQVDRNTSANSALPANSSISPSKAASGSSSSSSGSDYSVPVVISAPTTPTAGRSNLPNPALFPFLSRRLAAAGLGLPPPDASSAQRALQFTCKEEEEEDNEWYKRLREEGSGPMPVLDATKSSKMRYRLLPATQQVTLNLAKLRSKGCDTLCSPEKPTDSGAEEEEEQRKIAEGADALLNLAGICTTGRGTKRGGNSLQNVRQSKRQRLDKPDHQAKRQAVPQARIWKKASLHQGSKAHKTKSKDKGSRHRSIVIYP
ncbi:hypothetical protein B566_EDAN010189 [Ephemera danica]|nr:hypothetical protein B566_EDAN010189 [Ephemera danica]